MFTSGGECGLYKDMLLTNSVKGLQSNLIVRPPLERVNIWNSRKRLPPV